MNISFGKSFWQGLKNPKDLEGQEEVLSTPYRKSQDEVTSQGLFGQSLQHEANTEPEETCGQLEHPHLTIHHKLDHGKLSAVDEEGSRCLPFGQYANALWG